MRLTAEQRRAIRDAARQVFGPSAQVKLFGSRLDDDARGGDIDLLVELPGPVPDASALSARMVARIQRRIGVRKIDVVYAWPGMEEQPVHRVAKEEGIAV